MGQNQSRSRPNRPQQSAYPPPNIYQQGPQQYYGPDPQQMNNGHYRGGWHGPAAYPPMFPPHHHFGGPGTPQLPQQPNRPSFTPPPGAQEVKQTATIRNAVNLKKFTLALVPVEGQPSKLSVRFQVDASEPFVVSIFVVATEDAGKGCQITQLKGTPNEPIAYEKRLGAHFPKPEGPEVIIDVSLFEERQLTAVSGDTYPLIIRLECVSDKGKTESHQLKELKPGAPQRSWVQSQTTFAKLDKDEEGHWMPRVIKQKIWVEGTSYELQEIYGIENSSAGRSSADTGKQEVNPYMDDEERLCVICLVNERNTTVLPCRHMCMCGDCATELRKQTSKCPICRDTVDSMLEIKRPKATSKPAVDSAAAVTAAVNDLKLKD
ncbi:hypothetical protein CVIRNUC_006378 [Coccomyxa viridis]|uniref:RING-type E3 ubiquitin transferase n=1 Tax=Coccomyxa viridis TaxID=1274662 RepID=A0AAV1I750_9CHLO|nr:hypothetical protein CVIRNUC_006378 [Coccomyxa viridis]